MSETVIEPLGRYQHTRRIMLACLIAVIVIGLLFCRSLYGDGRLHEFVEAFGIGLISVGILGRLWCTIYIGGRKSAEIVSSGPYSVSRNPLYVFSTIAATGAGAQMGSVLVALFFGLITALAFHVVIRREERFLSGTFGAAYAEYRAHVPRFFPRLSQFRDADHVDVRPNRFYTTLGDGLFFLVAIPGSELIELAQGKDWLPVLLRLP